MPDSQSRPLRAEIYRYFGRNGNSETQRARHSDNNRRYRRRQMAGCLHNAGIKNARRPERTEKPLQTSQKRERQKFRRRYILKRTFRSQGRNKRSRLDLCHFRRYEQRRFSGCLQCRLCRQRHSFKRFISGGLLQSLPEQRRRNLQICRRKFCL